LETITLIIAVPFLVLLFIGQFIEMGKAGVVLLIMLIGLALAVWTGNGLGDFILYIGIPVAVICFAAFS